MVRLPWRSSGADPDEPRGGIEAEPLIVCEFQDGTVFVYDDHVYIDRAGPSKFDDKVIPVDEIVEVTYSKGIAIGYLQFEQAGVDNDAGGFLTSPIDENTLHYGRRDRACAERIRDHFRFGA